MVLNYILFFHGIRNDVINKSYFRFNLINLAYGGFLLKPYVLFCCKVSGQMGNLLTHLY